MGRCITHRGKLSIQAVRTIQALGQDVSTHRHAVCIGLAIHICVGRLPASSRCARACCPVISSKPRIVIMNTKPKKLFTTLELVRLKYHPVIIRHNGSIRAHGHSVTHVSHRRAMGPRDGCDFNRKNTKTCSSNGLCAHDGGHNDIRGVLGIFYRRNTSAAVLDSTRPRVNASGLPHIVRGVHRAVHHYNNRIRFRAHVSHLVMRGGRMVNVRADAKHAFHNPIVLTANRSTHSICQRLYTSNVSVRTGNVTMNMHLRRPTRLVSRVRCRGGGKHKHCLPTTRCDFIARMSKHNMCDFYVYPKNTIIPTTDNPRRVIIGNVSTSRHGSH